MKTSIIDFWKNLLMYKSFEINNNKFANKTCILKFIIHNRVGNDG